MLYTDSIVVLMHSTLVRSSSLSKVGRRKPCRRMALTVPEDRHSAGKSPVSRASEVASQYVQTSGCSAALLAPPAVSSLNGLRAGYCQNLVMRGRGIELAAAVESRIMVLSC